MAAASRPSVGLVGFGSVGGYLVGRFNDGALPEAELVAITANDLEGARRRLARYPSLRADIVPLQDLIARSDIVVECATADAFPAIARAVLEQGRTLLVLSAAGIVNFPDIVAFAQRHGGRLRLASGALPGSRVLPLKACRASSEANQSGSSSRSRASAGLRPTQ